MAPTADLTSGIDGRPEFPMSVVPVERCTHRGFEIFETHGRLRGINECSILANQRPERHRGVGGGTHYGVSDSLGVGGGTTTVEACQGVPKCKGPLLLGRTGPTCRMDDVVLKVRGEPSGLDEMNSDPQLGYLKVQGFAHRFEGVLRCRVGAAVGRGHPSGNAADVYDHTASSLAPCWENRSHSSQGAYDVGIKLALHEYIVNLFYCPLDFETGIVDQHINVGRVTDRRLNYVWFGDVKLTNLDVKAFFLSKPPKVLALRDGPHGGDHLMALPGKGENGQPAETAVTTSYKNVRHAAKYTIP